MAHTRKGKKWKDKIEMTMIGKERMKEEVIGKREKKEG